MARGCLFSHCGCRHEYRVMADAVVIPQVCLCSLGGRSAVRRAFDCYLRRGLCYAALFIRLSRHWTRLLRVGMARFSTASITRRSGEFVVGLALQAPRLAGAGCIPRSRACFA